MDPGFMKINKRLFPLIVIIVSSLFLVIFYGDFFYKPNAHLFNVSGDAIKNYYTYVAHSKHDNYIEFEQMNYPYGENFLYLDCHPLLTIIIKTIANVFPAINNYTVHYQLLNAFFNCSHCIICLFDSGQI